MSIFRFARIIEDRGRQYLLRAANNTYLVGTGGPPAPACALTVDTWVTTADGSDWDTMRLIVHMPTQVALLQALECFTKEHAREAYHMLAAVHTRQLTMHEQLAGQQRINDLVWVAILQRYGKIG